MLYSSVFLNGGTKSVPGLTRMTAGDGMFQSEKKYRQLHCNDRLQTASFCPCENWKLLLCNLVGHLHKMFRFSSTNRTSFLKK